MYIKILKIYIAIMLMFLLWLLFDVSRMLDLSKAQCEARGAEIVSHGNGNKICRYVRK